MHVASNASQTLSNSLKTIAFHHVEYDTFAFHQDGERRYKIRDHVEREQHVNVG